jgi:hypothetical protein
MRITMTSLNNMKNTLIMMKSATRALITTTDHINKASSMS